MPRGPSRVITLNRQGAIWLYIDEITKAYLDFVRDSHGTILEVAAGCGHVVIKALEAGAGRVFANEVDARQLAIVESRIPAQYVERLVRCLGQFPSNLGFRRPLSMASTILGMTERNLL